MEYRENDLSYEDYCMLRERVGWVNFSKDQMSKAITNSLYSVTAVEGERTVGAGRLVGDGAYFMITDLMVDPSRQRRGIGGKILDMLIEYAAQATPEGGRSSVQLITEKGKEAFYLKKGFRIIPHGFCGSAMRKVIRK